MCLFFNHKEFSWTSPGVPLKLAPGEQLGIQNKTHKKIYFGLFSTYLATLYFTLAGMELLSGLLCAFSLFIIIKDKNFKWPPMSILAPAVLLWITVGIGLWINHVPGEFVEKNFFKFRWVVELILFANLFRVFFEAKDLKRVLPWLDICIVIVLIYSIYQFFYGWDFFRPKVTFRELGPGSSFFRPNGFFSLTLTLASVAGMYFCWSLSRLLYRINPLWSREHVLNIASCLASLIVVFLSFTRGSWIAVTLAAMVITVLYRRKLIRYFTPAVLLIFTVLWFTFPDFKARIQSFDDMNYVNNVERMNIWKANWLMVKDYPIFGMGYGENIRLIKTYFETMGIPDAYGSHAHNNFLDFWAGSGTVGLIFFTLFVLATFIYSVQFYRRYKRQSHPDPTVLAIALAFIGIQVVLNVAGMTECTFRDKELNHEYILFACLVIAFNQKFRLKNFSSND